MDICTVWAEDIANTAWLIQHGFGLLDILIDMVKFILVKLPRRGKFLKKEQVKHYYAIKSKYHSYSRSEDLNLTQALTLTAYKRYASKPWVASDYLRDLSKNQIGYNYD